MALLTIVIPVYNGAIYIKSCLDNLEKQTFRDWNAIFINDGSSDDTLEVMNHLLKGKSRCKYINKENGGTAAARNVGMDFAEGKYITFLDVDDELDPTMYEKLVSLMEITGVEMGICGYYFKIEKAVKGKIETTYLEEKKYLSCVLKTREEMCLQLIRMWDCDILSNVWNKIYRLQLIKKKNLRYREGHVYTEDRVFNRLFIENASSMAVLDECLYYYVRERANSTTEKYRDDYFLIRHKEYVEFQAHFKKMGVWNDTAKEYVCREFTERISAAIENVFHADKKQLNVKEKYLKIKEMISHPDVIYASHYARYKSSKMKILAFPIKYTLPHLAYIEYGIVYSVRKANPALFHKLKSKR